MSNYFVTNCNRDYQTRSHSKFLLKCHLILHEKYLKTQFWKHRTFWTKGYFVSSIGNASIDIISKYIDEQG